MATTLRVLKIKSPRIFLKENEERKNAAGKEGRKSEGRQGPFFRCRSGAPSRSGQFPEEILRETEVNGSVRLSGTSRKDSGTLPIPLPSFRATFSSLHFPSEKSSGDFGPVRFGVSEDLGSGRL
jgi:hypothetical protein